jgi:endonuclease YncB( thermonuclease family)
MSCLARLSPNGIFLAFLLSATTVWAEQLHGTVVAIADGDTITVLDRDHVQHKVRLAGIDAPERRQAFGEKSRRRLAELLSRKNVVVETRKLDRYGRAVGKVLVDSKDAGLAQVESGLAWHYKKYEHEQDAGDRASYASAEISARSQKVGLWVDPDPVPPWRWRQMRKSGNAL